MDIDPRLSKKNDIYIDLQTEIVELEKFKTLSSRRFGRLKNLKESLANVETVNPMVWKILSKIPASRTVHQTQVFEDNLKGFSSKEGSHCETMGLAKYRSAEFGTPLGDSMGIMGKNKVFKTSSNVGGILTSVLKALQSSYRLGRFTNIESAFVPVLPGNEYEALYKASGKESLREARDAKVVTWHGEVSKLSWAMRAVFRGVFTWIPGIPIGAVWAMTREDELLDTTLNTAVYSKMGKWPDILKTSSQGCLTLDNDLYALVDANYQALQNEMRRRAETQANQDGQIGDSRKVKWGRIFRDPWSSSSKVEYMVNALMEKGIKNVMDQTPQSDVDLCWNILVKAYGRAGELENEDHLYTDDVREAAGRLRGSGISSSDIAVMSAATYLIDSVTSAAVRKQDARRKKAYQTYVDAKTGHLVDVLPFECKDDAALMKADGGMIVLHKKHQDLEKPCSVQIVLGRALMRIEGCELHDSIGPLDASGEQLTISQQRNLFIRAGKTYLGIPRFGEHALRTIQVSMLATCIVDLGIEDPEHNTWVIRAVREVRTSMKVALRHYDAAKNDYFTGVRRGLKVIVLLRVRVLLVLRWPRSSPLLRTWSGRT